MARRDGHLPPVPWARRLAGLRLAFSASTNSSSACNPEEACRPEEKMRATDRESREVKRQRILTTSDTQVPRGATPPEPHPCRLKEQTLGIPFLPILASWSPQMCTRPGKQDRLSGCSYSCPSDGSCDPRSARPGRAAPRSWGLVRADGARCAETDVTGVTRQAVHARD